MRFEVTTANAATQKTELVIVAVYQEGALSTAAKALDKAAGGIISEVLQNGETLSKVSGNRCFDNLT